MHNRFSARRRTGAILLEVIVALTIFGISALAATILVRQSVKGVESVYRRDAENRKAVAFMAAVSLWSREELDQRLGSRRQGAWLLYIDRPAESIYRLQLSDSTGRDVILETALFRAQP